MGAQQKVLLTKKMRADEVIAKRRRAMMKQLRDEALAGAAILAFMFVFAGMMTIVINDRIKKYPELGTEWIPKTEAQRQRESLPQKYTGR